MFEYAANFETSRIVIEHARFGAGNFFVNHRWQLVMPWQMVSQPPTRPELVGMPLVVP